MEDIDSETVGENLGEIVPGLIRVNNCFIFSYMLFESFFGPLFKQFMFFFNFSVMITWKAVSVKPAYFVLLRFTVQLARRH